MVSVSDSLHTQGVVSDYFAVESHMLSTRSADLQSAVDKTRNAASCIWTLRHPLSKSSDAVRRFLARMKALAEMTPSVSEMSAYGVDAAGVAFSVFPQLDGYSVVSGNIEPAEAERRFTSCVRLVERLHSAGIVCGDLCGSSFWVNRNGDVRFIGVMGSFDAEASQTSMLPPMETLPYLAPEQRGSGLEQASDVFALGVLGYFLFTKRMPYGEGAKLLMADFDIGQVVPISSITNAAPHWADPVLLKCLSSHPSERFPSAGDLFKAMIASRQKGHEREKSLIRSASAEVPRGQTIASSEEPDAPPVRMSKRLIKIISLAALATIVVFIAIFSRGNSNLSPEQIAKKTHLPAINDQNLKQAVNAVADKNSNPLGKVDQLEKIIASDDPLAHDVLVNNATGARDRETRELNEKAIIDRARRLGLLRAAEQVRQWLRSVRQGDLPNTYEPLLRSLDVTLPVEAVSAYLRQAYASEPEVVLKLAVALGIDTNKLEEYQPVISQLVGDAMDMPDAKSRSAVALILANPDLSVIFGEDVIQRKGSIPDRDVLWLLKMLAERNDINVRAIASLAVERGSLSAIRSQFLQLIRDRGDLPPDVLNALLRAAAASTKVEDIGSFGRWFDLAAEKVLLGICADTDDPAVALEAFDTLAGRSLSVEPSASLLTWVRKNYWDKRGELAKLVGVMGMLEAADQETVKTTIAGLDQYVRDSELVTLLVASENVYVVQAVLEKYSDHVGLGALLKLLDSPEVEVRKLAVRRLKNFNDIGALKIIVDHFEKEKDESVREVYRENFWMIKDRQG